MDEIVAEDKKLPGFISRKFFYGKIKFYFIVALPLMRIFVGVADSW